MCNEKQKHFVYFAILDKLKLDMFFCQVIKDVGKRYFVFVRDQRTEQKFKSKVRKGKLWLKLFEGEEGKQGPCTFVGKYTV